MITTIISCVSLFSQQVTNKKYKHWVDDAIALRIAYVLDPNLIHPTNVLFEFDDKNGQDIVNVLKPFLFKDENGDYFSYKEYVEYIFVSNKDSIYDKILDSNRDKLIEVEHPLKMLDVFTSVNPVLMQLRGEIHTAYVNHVADSLYSNRISKLPASTLDTLAIYVDYYSGSDDPLYFNINENDFKVIKQNIDPNLLRFAENGMNHILQSNSKPDMLVSIYDGRYFDTEHMIKRRITFSEYKKYLEALRAKSIAYDKQTKAHKRSEEARIKRNNAEYEKLRPKIIIIY